MKIRNGFVSNSSTSSFCVLGIKKNILNIDSDCHLLSLFNESQEELIYGYANDIFNYKHNLVFGISAVDIPNDITINDIRVKMVNHFKKFLNIDLNPEDIKWWIDGDING